MSRFLTRRTLGLCLLSAGLAVAVFLATPAPMAAQATISTGSVQGTVADPQGAAVPGAKITLTNKGTGQTIHLTTSSTGTYTSGLLIPGDYLVRVEAAGFKTSELPVTVQVGVISTGNIKLEIGQQSQVVEVQGSDVRVNTEQAAVQGVLTTEQIEQLPINGRNFLDLAQLEPGVQIQDGSNFDPTKVGFSSISFGGRFGRTARIEVDGVDVSDETVGTTTTNIPASALQEFQLSQSTLDLSNELTSSGAINVITLSGTNDLHGQLFGLFRDSHAAAALPGPSAPFQRNQFGGNFGGPIVKDKLFFFADAERIKQELFAPVPLSGRFAAFSGGFSSPFRETDVLGKLDWQATKTLHMFYRFTFFQNRAVSTFGAISFQPFNNKDITRTHLVGADFSTGTFNHSIRFQYLKFQNQITDAVRGTGLPLANFPISISIGSLATGPNLLAPQTTPQSNRQIKYDGSKILGAHIFRYGVAFNHIQGGGFAKFFSITPNAFTTLGTTERAFANTNPFGPGGDINPLNYPVEVVILGNGLGFSTEKPAFGFPLGGLGPDNRLGLYFGETWKVKPNVTLSAGVRYVRDTGRTDSDLPVLDAVNAVIPGFGNRVRQPNANLAPQAGLAIDPWKNGKTVIRAGIGMFYENVIFNNVLFDRPLRLTKGGFLSFPVACSGIATPAQVPFADGTNRTPPVGACADASGNPVSIGSAGALLAAFQNQFQAVAAQVGGNASNSSFLPNLIASGGTIPVGVFGPSYKTPRSIQMNVGIQREIRPGMVVSADYVRNVSLHFLLSVDVNHAGDASLLNKTAALNAINATNASFSCPAGPAGINCAIAAGASISDYAGNGLDSPQDLGVGACGVSLGFECAFAGINPAVGSFPLLLPVGRSVYNALQVKLIQNVSNPLRGIKHLNLQVSYALSRFTNPGAFSFSAPGSPGSSDQDFVNSALDNRDPLRFSGPSVLDRTHQLNFGAVVDLPLSFRVGFIGHFWSSLPASLIVPGVSGSNFGTAEIFRTDFTGDGTGQDLVPGTRFGAFGRDISAAGLSAVLTNYNNTTAGTPTPAGQALINAGFFTKAQLVALGAVAPKLPLAPPSQTGLGVLKALDLRLSWVKKFKERVTIEPSVAAFNLFNFANFDLPTSVLGSLLTGEPCSINGTTRNGVKTTDCASDRVGVGTGVFGLGAPRVFEFGLKITF